MDEAALKFGWCLLVHKNPSQVHRLLVKIYRPSDFYYVNIFNAENDATKECWADLLSFPKNVKVVFRYEAARANIKLVQATLDGMRFFRDLDLDYFINMSGQCYPLKPISLVEKQLSDGLSHIEFSPIPGWGLKGENGGLDRINYRWFNLRGRTIRIPRIHRSLPENMKPYGGSQWLCLSKTHMDYIVDYLASHPNVLKFFEHSKIPDEMVFQTVLMNSTFAGQVLNRLEWYVDWREAIDGRPAILTVNHIPDMLACGRLFARKFEDEQLFRVIEARNSPS